MSGGISQLVAIGAQDAHLVGDPQVSFFKSAYMRHTNFSMITDRQIIQGNITNDAMTSVRFERKGDLLSHVYITARDATGVPVTDIPETGVGSWSNIISKTELYIGGQLIDSQTTDFTENIAPDVLAQNYSKGAQGVRSGAVGRAFYPLRFSFCENWSSALPLVALQYHDVEIRIYWETKGAHTYDVYANYIFLDTDERETLASNPMNMLLTQVQEAVGSDSKIQELSFNHPMKYLACAGASSNLVTSSSSNKVKLQINGTDITDFKNSYINHGLASNYYFTSQSDASPSVFIYPFCLDTAKIQPSGTLNFSRLDSVRLITDAKNIGSGSKIYGVNYNVLAIKNGMGGLMYAN